ncbi:MAG: hypothetical protein COA78_36775 [Blastopirellula sp.]|nr:MAG: hypothetical protein COA78_36775 [Blastopirellula sp.]
MSNAIKALNTKAGAAAVVVVGVALIGYYAQRKAAKVLPDIAQAINPVNDNNVFASGVNAVGAKISGNGNWSLGGAIYDLLN